MDQKIVRRLEKELLKAIADVIARIGLRGLPLLPSHRTLEMIDDDGAGGGSYL